MPGRFFLAASSISALLRAVRSFKAVLLLAIGLVGCETPSERQEAADNALMGGEPATAHPAVGAFVSGQEPQRRSFCTGTLVAPRLVVTAKHCTENLPSDAAFAFGPDARTPERLVGIASFERATPDDGGFMSLGSDVAGVVLAEAVLDIAPVPLASRALDASDVGQRFVAVGYGVQGKATARDTRQAGSLTLFALDGAPLETRYPTLSRFLDAANEHYDYELGTFQIEALTLKYERKLLTGYEAYLADDTVQTCHGDSGGPILRATESGFELVAVVSGGPLPALTFRPGKCAGGNIVALVDPARPMLDRLAQR